MKAGVNAPGLIAVGIGVLSLVIGLFSLANGSRSAGVAAVVVAVLLVGGGLAWLARTHHKVQEKQQDWHPGAPRSALRAANQLSRLPAESGTRSAASEAS
jgi:hypothetical protein